MNTTVVEASLERLPALSTARTSMRLVREHRATEPDHCAVPLRLCHSPPLHLPSTDAMPLAPGCMSSAVPSISSGVLVNTLPLAGLLMATAGGVISAPAVVKDHTGAALELQEFKATTCQK